METLHFEWKEEEETLDFEQVVAALSASDMVPSLLSGFRV
jgi:hypothetical protein